MIFCCKIKRLLDIFPGGVTAVNITTLEKESLFHLALLDIRGELLCILQLHIYIIGYVVRRKARAWSPLEVNALLSRHGCSLEL